MPDRKELLQDFYAKYAPDQELTDERLNAINTKYGDDNKKLLSDFYAKYAPEQELSDERYFAIENKYNLKKKEPTIPPLGQAFKLGGESTPQLPLTSQSRLGEKPKLNPFTATPEELKAAYPTPIDNKRASLKMYNDANKLTIDRINKKQKIKDLNAEMENISAQIPQIEAIYKDETQPYEVRKQAETELKNLYAKGKQIQTEGKPLIDDINNSAKKTIGLLKGGRELNTQANYDLSEQNTGFLEYLGGNIANGAVSMGESVVRILPYLQGGIVPEAAKYESRQIADKMHKYGEELANFGLDPNLEKLFTTKGWNNPKKYGYILGKAIGQSIPAAAAGLATGGSGTAVALVGGLQGFSETYNILSENKGLTEQQKMLLSTGAAIPLGLLEEYGMGDVLKLMTGSSLKKEVAKNLLKETATLGAKNLTKEELFQVGVKTFGETLKEFAPKLLKTSNKEGFTEVLQSETNEGIKQIGEAISGEDSNKDQTKTQYVINNLKSGLEDYGFGAIGGTSLGSIGSYHEAKYNKPIYEQAILLKDPKAFDDFNELLQSEIQNGNLTQEEAVKSLNIIKSIQEADALIPQTIKDNTKRGYAVNLVSEKKDLEEQIVNSDKSLATDLQDKVDAINSELEKIGNNENTFGLLEYNVGELEDDKYYTFYVKSENEIPEQYRDRVRKLADIETKKTVLGIPYGKSEKQKGYSYTLTGKELKQIYEQDNNTEDDLSETQAPQEITTEPTSTEGVEANAVGNQFELIANKAFLDTHAIIQPILQRMNNAEYINEKEVERGTNELYDLLDSTEKRKDLSEDDKIKISESIEELINKLENYEFTTATKTKTVTEKQTVPIPKQTSREVKQTEAPLRKAEGSTAEVETANGNKVSGTLNIRGGQYVLDNRGNQIILGEAAITDRDLKLGDRGIELDPETDQVSSITLDINGNQLTITDPETALDLAIKVRLQEIPFDVDQTLFDETMQEVEVEKQITTEELKNSVSIEEQQAIDEAIPNLAEPLKKEIKGLTTIENLMSEGVLEYVDEQTGEPCMKHGIRGNSFKRGSKWEIVKDLKGYKTHEQGGVDLTIGSDGIKIKNGKTDYYAKNGLLMPNN